MLFCRFSSFLCLSGTLFLPQNRHRAKTLVSPTSALFGCETTISEFSVKNQLSVEVCTFLQGLISLFRVCNLIEIIEWSCSFETSTRVFWFEARLKHFHFIIFTTMFRIFLVQNKSFIYHTNSISETPVTETRNRRGCWKFRRSEWIVARRSQRWNHWLGNRRGLG